MAMFNTLTNQLALLAARINATFTVETKVTKNVKSVPDPGPYNGSYENFHIWWMKMRVYLHMNKETFTTNKNQCLEA